MMNYAAMLRELADKLDDNFDHAQHRVGFQLIDIGFQLHSPFGITDLRDLLDGVLRIRNERKVLNGVI